MQIAVVGSINTDITINVATFAKPNETVIGADNYILSQGGKGANQAAAAAASGAQVHMIAQVGDDDLGSQAIKSLKSAGVHCEHIKIADSSSTGLAAILVNQDGDNSITVAPGANNSLTPQNITAAKGIITQSDCLILQLEIPLETVEAAINLAHKNGVPTILNPAPASKKELPFLSQVDFLIPNEIEAYDMASLYGDTPKSPEEAARCLIKAGVKNIVITLGSKGCLIANAEGLLQRIKPYPVKAVDTTGAGDTFCGFLANALSQGKPLATAAEEASAAASLSVTRPQARSQLPNQAEVSEFMKQHPDR